MIWKGLAVLSGAAGVVILGVLALALITVPDEPIFAAGLEEADVGEDGSVDFPGPCRTAGQEGDEPGKSSTQISLIR